MKSISPRQLAEAAGVSESSVKRWCDQGLIPTIKTAGGHRRLTLDAAAEFLRSSNTNVRPELIGLPPLRKTELNFEQATERLVRILAEGDEDGCRRMILDLHMAGHPVSRIFDEVVAPAFYCVGVEWERHDLQIYQERRACNNCQAALEELKLLIPPPRREAPLAIGGTPECDPYSLPTAMVELVLRQSGWRARSLGSRLPFSTLLVAVRDAQPDLFWLSVSHLDDEQEFLRQYRAFYEQLPPGLAIVVGGRVLTEPLRRQMEFTAHCDKLQHLESLVKTLQRNAGAVKSEGDRGHA